METNNINAVNEDTIKQMISFRSLLILKEKFKIYQKNITQCYIQYNNNDVNKPFTTFISDNVSDLVNEIMENAEFRMKPYSSYEDIFIQDNNDKSIDQSVIDSFVDFVKEGVKKYNEMWYKIKSKKTINDDTNSISSEAIEMIEKDDTVILQSDNELFSDTLPIMLTEFISQNSDKYYIVDLINEIDVKEIDKDIRGQLNKNKRLKTKESISSSSSKKILSKSRSTINLKRQIIPALSLKEVKISSDATIELIKDKKRIKSLQEIFSFYTSQRKLLGKSPTFDSIQNTICNMDVSEFLKFCNEFKISLNKTFLIQIFQSTSHKTKQINFDSFISSLLLIAIEINKSKMKFTDNHDIINDLLLFMDIDEPNKYRDKMKGFIKPFAIYYDVNRIPKLSMPALKLFKSQSELSKRILTKIKEVKQNLSQHDSNEKNISHLNRVKQLMLKNQMFQMKMLDKTKYMNYIKLRDQFQRGKRVNNNDIRVSWDDVMKSNTASFIIDNDDQVIKEIVKGDKEEEELNSLLKRKQRQKNRIKKSMNNSII